MVGSTPTCQCNTGYTGFPNCNIPTSCSTKACGINMHCRMSGSAPVCECNEGYYPSPNTVGNCIKYLTQVSCATKSCSTNQDCIMSSGMAKCECKSGWTGDNCNTDVLPCTKACAHGGTCKFNSNEQQYCDCTVGWTGDECFESVDVNNHFT